MKFTSSTKFWVFAVGFAAAAFAQDVKLNVPGAAPAAPAAPAAAPAFTEEQMLEALGWLAGKQMQLDTFGFSPAQVSSMMKGIHVAAQGKDSPYDQSKIGPMIQEFVQKKQQEYMDKLKKEGLAETTKFLATLKGNKAVVELPSGLRYEVVQAGQGANPKPSDTVKVHYTGKLINGNVFDSSVQRGEPVEFPLDQVIPGWTEGIQKINKGGKIKLYIPPHLAYGDDGRPGIPPSSTLVFDVELIDFKPSPGPASLKK